MICEHNRNKNWCDQKDVQFVQMKSAGGNVPNEYEGPVFLMCKGCRKANNGTFKTVRNVLKQSKEDLRKQRAARLLYDETAATP